MRRTPQQMKTAMIESFAARTGKSLEQWMAAARASGLVKRAQVVKMLKQKHGLSHADASLLAHCALESRRCHDDRCNRVQDRSE